MIELGRGAACVAVLVALVTTLSGCQFASRPPDLGIGIRSDDGKLEILLCRETLMTEISVDQRWADVEWHTVWDENLVLDLPAGARVRAQDIATSGSALKEPRLAPGDEIVIIINSSAGATYLGDFRIPETGPPTEEWLLSDSSLDPAPCSD